MLSIYWWAISSNALKWNPLRRRCCFSIVERGETCQKHDPYPGGFFFSLTVKLRKHHGTSQVVKNPPANSGNTRDMSSIPGSGRSPWIRKWPPTPVFLPGESHGQRSPAGYSPWGCRESDTTENTHYTVCVIPKHYQCRILAAIHDAHLNQEILKRLWSNLEKRSQSSLRTCPLLLCT